MRDTPTASSASLAEIRTVYDPVERSGKFFRNTAFIVGSVVGGYLGYELSRSSQFFPGDPISYVVYHHPYLTMAASTVLGGAAARSFAQGLQELFSRPKEMLSGMRDDMFGVRRNGK
ncbi:MAG: hypothetical protein AABY00_01755 [Nanoarchaeota archaeon]